jgi:hypothetical protein
MVIWLESPIALGDVDKFVTAEVPPLSAGEDLRRLVLKNQLHKCYEGCGGLAGACRYGYPHSFNTTTAMDDSSRRVAYRRRPPPSSSSEVIDDAIPSGMSTDAFSYHRGCGDQDVNQDDIRFLNQHIVPYNLYLMLHLRCHLNLEIACGLKSIKYLFK